MTRTSITYSHSVTDKFKAHLLEWAQPNDYVLWLDSNNYPQSNSKYKSVLAVGAHRVIKLNTHGALSELQDVQESTDDWLFGYLSYDLKNEIEDLTSSNFDGLNFPDLCFFQPQKLFLMDDESVEQAYHPSVADEAASDWSSICSWKGTADAESSGRVKMRLRMTKDSYFEKIERMLRHIHRGDIYEANFCQEFFAEDVVIDPLRVFQHLNRISRPPFACYLKIEDLFAISASPERYLMRTGTRVISQPIKGTARRGQSALEDASISQALQQDSKERSENIMIVDLVRNDLSRVAVKGSVQVEELCGLYSFKQVHQLISTVACEVSPKTRSIELIKHTFPMGSMTGAPKVSAMKIIEHLEETKRGLYSGAIGYFDPNGDFDFNVVIRSILYHSKRRYLSVSVGGAITAESVPEKEYEECLVKAKAMREVLEGDHSDSIST